MSEHRDNRNALGRLLPAGVDVGPVPSPGVPVPPRGEDVGRVPLHGESPSPPNAASGNAAYNKPRLAAVGRVPSHGVPAPAPADHPPRRLRRLHRVWRDRDGNISYLLTPCVDGRARVLDNEETFQRLVAFLLDSPKGYHWFGRRFVIMPDHIHLIAHMGHAAIRLGQWVKALKAVVGGLERRDERPVRVPGLQDLRPAAVGRVSPHGVPTPSRSGHEFNRIKRAWRWQDGFHDHKFRTPESEARKWEYVCLNPVRYGLVKRPEDWPFGGEIYYEDAGGPRLVRGTPPLLETGILIEDGSETPREEEKTPGKGTRPTP